MASSDLSLILDELIIEMDTLSFDLRMLLARYVSEFLAGRGDRTFVLNPALTLPVNDGDNYHTVDATVITIEGQTLIIMIRLVSGDYIPWDDLSISAQDIVVREIHHQYIAARLMGVRDDKEKH